MFGTKSKGAFIDLHADHALVARTTGCRPPFSIVEVGEIALGNEEDGAAALRGFFGVRGTGYTTASCAVYPPGGVVSRVTIDSKKFRDEGYMAELVREALKVEAADYNLFALSTADGSDVTTRRNLPRDVLVCGAPIEELTACQDKLLEIGVFPLSMELGAVAAIGGVVHYLATSGESVPTLLLEVGTARSRVFIVTGDGVEITRMVDFGIDSMVPQVQRELALKDEESARKLLFSNSFDFTGMCAQLTKRLIRELQASIGFYEVQTGQSVGRLCCTALPSKVAWLECTLADLLGMKLLTIDYAAWLGSMGIALPASVDVAGLGSAWNGLFCLMGQYKSRLDEAAA